MNKDEISIHLCRVLALLDSGRPFSARKYVDLILYSLELKHSHKEVLESAKIMGLYDEQKKAV